ncbi:transcriptional regulator, TetR family [Saccharopolyspora kobensis]|uniref:Transcriptional regulator, TetR family n=1 Tax=Saccharopolyspora kobensis TaxID=146035 RepID=A0A1H5XZS6_9PSEU|nr:WHG domain-containing protein [Saccharopolyspora kobensis]SEG17254.1 transcriptional regulator, TetR family [Saccharopolyspora kobensis]SFF09835.1 transcriptional regulator, TetR family [Saccharopolyspora kobensis]
MARAGLTAERITEAAADMADTAGFTGVTVSALARHFGVKDASLYSHVRNLAELRARVAVLAAGELSDRIGSAIAGRAGREALMAFADAYRSYALEHPGRYAATQLQLDPEIASGSSGHRRCMELPYSLLRGYGLAEPDITDAVRLLRSTFHGYAHIEGSGGFGHPRDVRASWERAVHALHTALENWPGSEDA